MKRFATLIAATVVLSTASASSEPGAPERKVVRVLEPSCALRLVDLAQYTAVLRVELDAAGFTLDESGTADGSALTLVLEASPCEPRATSVDVIVLSPASGQREHRVVPVWDLDVSARPRAVALASTELLVRVAWRDPEAPASPPPGDSALPPAPAAPAPSASASAEAGSSPPPSSPPPSHSDAPRDVERRAPGPRRPWHPPDRTLGIRFEYRSYPVLHTPMLGGRILGRLRLGDGGLELGVDAGASTGSVQDALGTVRVTSATIGVDLAQVAGGPDVLVAVGPALEAGYGHVTGEPVAGASGGAQGSFLAAALLDAGLRLRWGADGWLTADALGGYSISALRGLADDRPVAGTSGVMVALRVGAARAW